MKPNRHFFGIVLSLIGASAGSACDKGDGRDPLEHYCADVNDRAAVCNNIAIDPAGPCNGCFDPCLDRAHEAAKFSEACGELWVEVYECLAEMPCEGFPKWEASLSSDSVDYPCGKLEVDFHEKCPGVALFPIDAGKS